MGRARGMEGAGGLWRGRGMRTPPVARQGVDSSCHDSVSPPARGGVCLLTSGPIYLLNHWILNAVTVAFFSVPLGVPGWLSQALMGAGKGGATASEGPSAWAGLGSKGTPSLPPTFITASNPRPRCPGYFRPRVRLWPPHPSQPLSAPEKHWRRFPYLFTYLFLKRLLWLNES